MHSMGYIMVININKITNNIIYILKCFPSHSYIFPNIIFSQKEQNFIAKQIKSLTLNDIIFEYTKDETHRWEIDNNLILNSVYYLYKVASFYPMNSIWQFRLVNPIFKYPKNIEYIYVI